MLLVLKIPIVYLSVVIWWAIRAEPSPPAFAEVATVANTPSANGSARRRRAGRRRPTRPHVPGRGAAAAHPPREGIRA